MTTNTKFILYALPATSVELAAQLGSSTRLVNAVLQYLKAKGMCYHKGERVRPLDRRRGPAPFLWYRR